MDAFKKDLKEYKKNQRFLKYAKDNGILFNANIPSKKLYALCNRHRDDYLCYEANYGRGTLINTKCYKQGYNEEYCEGWYTTERRCGCGVKWGLEYFYDDDVWERVDWIDQDEPLGIPNRS